MSAAPAWWAKPRVVSVVVDNDSWVVPYAEQLVNALRDAGDDAAFVRDYADVREGAAAFYFGCLRITPPPILARNRRNLVVHASDLPKGRGFSPTTWLILEGANRIPVCLLDAADEADAGPVIYREWIGLEGHELMEEVRHALGAMHVTLALRMMAEATPPRGIAQDGEATRYPRRKPDDSRLDPEKSIAGQFNLLRVVDNDRYPAFFDYAGHRYILRITKAAGES